MTQVEMTDKKLTDEIWILGATGRIGRRVASALAARGAKVVLVGRNRGRLDELSRSLGAPVGSVIADGPDRIVDEITTRRPAVVVNTVGPFSETGVPIARACLPGGHYLDLANDLVAVPALLGLHDEAAAAGSTLITGAGFGFIATEAVVAKLCEGLPTPRSVHVDAIPSVQTEGGPLGEALAATIVEAIPQGSRRYENSRLTKARLGAGVKQIALPDGETIAAGSAPLGDLHAAWLISGAPTVVASSSGVPTAAIARAMMPVVGAAMTLGPVRRFATQRMASMSPKPSARPRDHSWGHVRVEWNDRTREGWLRTEDAMAYTAAVAAEVATRLAAGHAPAGAFTPTGALGPDIATSTGAEFVLD